MACLLAKPDVDRLESMIKDHVSIIRLDVRSEAGKYLRAKYSTGLVPTFIVFDSTGNETWRHSGSVPSFQTILSFM